MRIDEVSAVDKGAGRGVKIMLMKRDDSDLAKATAALFESVASIVDLDQDKADAINETLGQFREYLSKSAVDGDDADRDDGDGVQRFSQMFSNSKAASEEPMTREELKAERAEQLRAVVKDHGITTLAKGVVAGLTGIDEHELTALATEHAQRVHPDVSPAQAFEKVYMADTTLREAISIAKAAEVARYYDTVHPMPR